MVKKLDAEGKGRKGKGKGGQSFFHRWGTVIVEKGGGMEGWRDGDWAPFGGEWFFFVSFVSIHPSHPIPSPLVGYVCYLSVRQWTGSIHATFSFLSFFSFLLSLLFFRMVSFFLVVVLVLLSDPDSSLVIMMMMMTGKKRNRETRDGERGVWDRGWVCLFVWGQIYSISNHEK